MLSNNILRYLGENSDALSASESKISAIVTDRPDAVIEMSIAKLARESGVSEPSVLRFCRSLGCSGFPDFKIKLARNMVAGGAHLHQSVGVGDSPHDVVHKIVAATVGTLVHVRDTLDLSQLERAIDALASARRVEFYGVGASGIVAQDAHHKFFRLDVSSAAYIDPHMQLMSAATLHPGDVLMVFSHTGRTQSMISAAGQAMGAGATVIAVTSPGSPLAGEVDIALDVDAPEDTDHYTPMTSRIAHLTVVDILATGVALKRGPELSKHLTKMKASLMSERFTAPDLKNKKPIKE